MKPNHHLLIQTYENTLLNLSEIETNKLLGVLKKTGRGRPSTYRSVKLERSFLSGFEEVIRDNCKNRISEEKLNNVFAKLASVSFDTDRKGKPSEIEFVKSVEGVGLDQTEVFRFAVIVFSLYFREKYTQYIEEYVKECTKYKIEIDAWIDKDEELAKYMSILDRQYEKRILLEDKTKLDQAYEKAIKEKKKELRPKVKRKLKDKLVEPGWSNKFSLLPNIIEKIISIRIQDEVNALPKDITGDRKIRWEYFLHSYFSISFESSEMDEVKDSKMLEAWIKKQICPVRESLCNLAIILRWSEDELNSVLNSYGHCTLVLRNPESAILQWALVHNRKALTGTPFIDYILAYCQYKIELVKALYDKEHSAENLEESPFEKLKRDPLSVFPLQYNYLPSEQEEKTRNWNSAWENIDKFLLLEPRLCNKLKANGLYYEEDSLSSKEKSKYDKRIKSILGAYSPERNRKKRKNIKKIFDHHIMRDILLDEVAFKCDLTERQYLTLKPVFNFESTCNYKIDDINFLICYRAFCSMENGYSLYIDVINKLQQQKNMNRELRNCKKDVTVKRENILKLMDRIVEPEEYSEEDKRFIQFIAEQEFDESSDYQIREIKDLILRRNIVNEALIDYRITFKTQFTKRNDLFLAELFPATSEIEFVTTLDNSKSIFKNSKFGNREYFFPNYISDLRNEYTYELLSKVNQNSNQYPYITNILRDLEQRKINIDIQRIIKENPGLKNTLINNMSINNRSGKNAELIYALVSTRKNKGTHESTLASDELRSSEFFIDYLVNKLKSTKFSSDLVKLRADYFYFIRDTILTPMAKLVCINNKIQIKNNSVLKDVFLKSCPRILFLDEVAKKVPVSEDSSSAFTTICLNLISAEDDPTRFSEALSILSNQFDINRESSRRETARLLSLIFHNATEKMWNYILTNYSDNAKIKEFTFEDYLKCISSDICLSNIILENAGHFSHEDIERINDILKTKKLTSGNDKVNYKDLICFVDKARYPILFKRIEKANRSLEKIYIPSITNALEEIFFGKGEPSILLLKMLADLAGEKNNFEEVRKNAKFSHAPLVYEQLEEDVFYYKN